jgi:transposase
LSIKSVVIKMARPSKLTPEVTKRLTEAIRAGNYYEAACGYAGIHYSTFRKWMQKGETAKSGKFREFFDIITRAEYEAEVRMVAQWQKHMPDDYRAIRDFLERRYPDRWGRRNLNIEHSGDVGIKIVDDIPIQEG